jgi:glycogen synthase
MTERFDWKASAARYVELYKGAVDRRSGAVLRTW